VLNKSDLADAVGFDRSAALSHLRAVAPQAVLFEVSARQGSGLAALLQWLDQPQAPWP
jgi:hydrogenase nickel incorporation protein HypB